MASLKEVKTRIASVANMRKITQARQMISSAQLHRAQALLDQATLYKEALDRLLAALLRSNREYESPYTLRQQAGPAVIVILSSNSGMCGTFNANMIKRLQNIRTDYPEEQFLLFPVGKKIREAAEHTGYTIGYEPGRNADHLAGKTTYQESGELAARLMELYRSRQVKRVGLVYYQFRNMAIQEIRETTLLPLSLPPSLHAENTEAEEDFILEPSGKEVIDRLLSMAIKANVYYALMQNQASEHGARTLAMQMATENAEQLLSELQLTYNKLRQQNITSELLDIIGSSFA